MKRQRPTSEVIDTWIGTDDVDPMPVVGSYIDHARNVWFILRLVWLYFAGSDPSKTDILTMFPLFGLGQLIFKHYIPGTKNIPTSYFCSLVPKDFEVFTSFYYLSSDAKATFWCCEYVFDWQIKFTKYRADIWEGHHPQKRLKSITTGDDIFMHKMKNPSFLSPPYHAKIHSIALIQSTVVLEETPTKLPPMVQRSRRYYYYDANGEKMCPYFGTPSYNDSDDDSYEEYAQEIRRRIIYEDNALLSDEMLLP